MRSSHEAGPTLEQLFGQLLGVAAAELDDDSSPATIPTWTSLMNVNLLVATEEEYGVGFDRDELGSLWSLGDFRRALRNRGIPA